MKSPHHWKSKSLAALFLAGLMAFASPGSAAVTIGGFNFANNAFADSLISSSGSYTFSGINLVSSLTDINEGTFALSNNPGAYVELGFVDNFLVNGSGSDLVLFELGVPNVFKVSTTVGGTVYSYLSSWTGFYAAGYELNAATINLDDLGLASGAQLSSIVIGLDTVTSGLRPSLSLAGALHSAPVPEPSTVVLLALTLSGFATLRRRRN